MDRHLAFSKTAKLPTVHGDFLIQAVHDQNEPPHLLIFRGIQKFSGSAVPVRIHSECLTGESLGSLRCDCRFQLSFSLDYIAKHGGLTIYLRQEGRGIGLFHKINAYYLQDRGMDTIEANHELGFATDARDYSIAVQLLTFLGISSVRLLTNNPSKITYLTQHGISVTKRIPIPMNLNRHNARYLYTKRTVMNHDIPLI